MAEEKSFPIKEYAKITIRPMVEWNEHLDMSNVFISKEDKYAGSPKKGDMIAINPSNPDDQELVSEAEFKANYIPRTLLRKE